MRADVDQLGVDMRCMFERIMARLESKDTGKNVVDSVDDNSKLKEGIGASQTKSVFSAYGRNKVDLIQVLQAWQVGLSKI